MDEKNLEKSIEWFDKKEGNLQGEELIFLKISQLKSIFNISDNYDPYMAYSYPIREKHIEQLQPYLQYKIDLNMFNYFISIYKII